LNTNLASDLKPLRLFAGITNSISTSTLIKIMQLLGLPPEIFELIVQYLIKDHGLSDAMKVRGTSREL
jgi:hypothetical protein